MWTIGSALFRLTSVRTVVIFGFGFLCNVPHSYSSASMLGDGITAIDGIGFEVEIGDTVAVAVGVYPRLDTDKRCWFIVTSVVWNREMCVWVSGRMISISWIVEKIPRGQCTRTRIPSNKWKWRNILNYACERFRTFDAAVWKIMFARSRTLDRPKRRALLNFSMQ